jgi:hypothetical protein
MIDPNQSSLAGGVPTAPSIGGAQPTPQEQAPQGAVPVSPDGASLVQDALRTLVKFGVSQNEQGNPAIMEAIKPLVQALMGGGAMQQQPETEQEEMVPEQSTMGASAGGQIPVNA